MRVFLSWSGATSRELAEALHDWIPCVIQNAKPFMSAGDIDKGKRWSDVVGEELNQSDYGNICITRYNCASPWLHFEAGAISRALGNSYVSPLLFNVEPSVIEGPFRQFQMTVCSTSPGSQDHCKHEIRSLIRSINQRLEPGLRLTEELLKIAFDKWWPDLLEKIRPIANKRDGATHTPYGWLYAFEDLIDVQCSEGQVCWITPNPYAYALQPKVKKAIQDKIANGATYTFLVNRQFRDSAKDELRRIARCDRRPIQVFEIPDKDFHELAVTDYVVVTDRDSNTRVFLELPLARDVGPGGTAPGFWIEVFKEVAAGFLDRTKRLTDMATLAASTPPGEAAAPDHGNTTTVVVN
jgi:hypothetical protein